MFSRRDKKIMIISIFSITEDKNSRVRYINIMCNGIVNPYLLHFSGITHFPHWGQTDPSAKNYNNI